MDVRSRAGSAGADADPHPLDRPRSELDIRQLRVLKTLLSERSASRTAVLHGISQPAVSLTLRRMRAITGDPLLVRAGNGLVRTERGDDLAILIDRILSDVDHLVGREVEFDPAASQRPIRIVAATGLGPYLVPELVRSLRRLAPGMTLEISAMPNPAALDSLLESGEADLVLSHRSDVGHDLRSEELMECAVVCMMDQAHPCAGRTELTLDDYLGLEHLSPNPPHAMAASPIDGRLLELGRNRTIRTSIAEYAMVPFVLPGSDLVFTSVRPFADFLARMGDFAVVDAPEEFGAIRFYMLWHERAHHSNVHAWLRGFVREALLRAQA